MKGKKNPFPVLFVQLETELLVLSDVREAPLFCPSPRQCGPTSVVHKTGPGNSANFEARHCFWNVLGATDRMMFIHQQGWGLQNPELRTPTGKEWRREVWMSTRPELEAREDRGEMWTGEFSSWKILEKHRRTLQLRPCEGLCYTCSFLY